MEQAIENNIKSKKMPKQRIWELDFFRGICVLLMIFDHTMYDIAYNFGSAWCRANPTDFYINLVNNARVYWNCDLRAFVEPLVVFIFCIICGISCSFSRSNLKRGIEIAVCSVLITIVTTAIDIPITFGIFQMFTVAILLWCIINFLCRNNRVKTMFACGILGIAIITINYILITIAAENPTAFTNNNDWYFLGKFMVVDWSALYNTTNDYQPIFPLVGYMLLGAGFGPLLYWNKKSLFPHIGKYDWYKPISFWGKIAMWVYILHQVIIAAILALLSFLFITPGNWVII